jgi:hypothetical protein
LANLVNGDFFAQNMKGELDDLVCVVSRIDGCIVNQTWSLGCNGCGTCHGSKSFGGIGSVSCPTALVALVQGKLRFFSHLI